MASRRALLVACGDYQALGLPLLRGAPYDARRLKSVLERPGVGDFQTEQIINPDLVDAQKFIHQLLSQAGSDDLTILYLSGHGVKDPAGRFHLALPNTDLDALPATALSGRFLREQLADTPCQRLVVILDACYAGAFGRELLAKSVVSAPGVPDELLANGRGHAILAASTAIQLAFESTDGEPSSDFTRVLCEGLESGDADLNEDGWVGLQELFEYLRQRFGNQTLRQTPQLTYLGSTGDLLLTKAPMARRSDRLDEDVQAALRSIHPELRLAAAQVLGRYTRSQNPARRQLAGSALADLGDDYDEEIRSIVSTIAAESPARSRAKLTTAPAEGRDEPTSPMWVQLPLTRLQEAARSAPRFVGRDTLLSEYARVQLWFEGIGSLHVCATDRYRLDYWELPSDAAGSEPFRVGVPAAQFEGLTRLTGNGIVRLDIAIETLDFSTSSVVATLTRDPAGKFDLRDLLAKVKTGEECVSVEARDLIDAAEAATRVRNRRGRRVHSYEWPGRITLTLEGPAGRASVKGEAGLEPPPVTAVGGLTTGPIVLNSEYLTTALSAFGDTRVVLALNGRMLVMRAHDSSQEVHQHIIMSMSE